MPSDNVYRIALSGGYSRSGIDGFKEVGGQGQRSCSKDGRHSCPHGRIRKIQTAHVGALCSQAFHNLFLRGKILCLPLAGTPSGAFAEPQSETLAVSRVFGLCKTATQIVHEQLTEDFKYGIATNCTLFTLGAPLLAMCSCTRWRS